MVSIGLEAHIEKIKELLNEFNIDSDNDIAVLGFLQHHGCPTPLLDWTFKFQNALYFALDGLTPKQNASEVDDYFSVYYIKEEHFDVGSMRKVMMDSLDTIGQDLKSEYIKAIAKDEPTRIAMEIHFKERSFWDKTRFKGSGMIKHMTEIKRMVSFPITYFSDKDVESGIVFSLNNSKNILNQKGVFTWNSYPSKPLEMIGNEQYSKGRKGDEAEDYRFSQCFNIHKSLEHHIRKRLEKDGITKEYIYPSSDIDTYAIFEKAKKDNAK